MKKMSRGAFLLGSVSAATLAATSGCMCTKTGRATVTGVGCTPAIDPKAYKVVKGKCVRVYLAEVSQLADVGGSVKIIDPDIGDSLIVVREAADRFVAASIKCTHRGVEVEYQPEERCFKCASLGGSRFRTSGERVGGFAKKPLAVYPVSIDNNVLVIGLTGEQEMGE
ncbi:MAG: Rieske (2Fe-2S) protein [Kiritimatiellae bacterium]|nr:Rieske (2Fe-2S) protein [Kiritimatiellia bacterium]